MSIEPGGVAKDIRSVQYLRALAVTLVVYFHTKVYTPDYAWTLPRDFGASGVDLFFVISGFIMVTITSRGDVGVGEFLTRRFIRIAPLYWLVTLLILCMYLLFPASMLNNFATFDHVVLSLLFIPHVNPVEGSYAPFFKLGWTLNYEAYFYVIFAVLLLIPSLQRRLVALTIYFAAAVAFHLMFHPTLAAVHNYSNPIILEFWIGAVVAYLYVTDRLSKLPQTIAWAFVVIGGTAMVVLFDSQDLARVETAGVAAGFTLAGLLAIESKGALWNAPLLLLLGDASYSIYLAHPLVNTVARLGAKALRLPVDHLLIGASGVISTTLLAVLAGVLAHLWIEKPLLAALRRRLSSRRKAVAAPAGVGVLANVVPSSAKSS